MFDRWQKLVKAEKERQQKKVQKTCTKGTRRVKKPGKSRE